VKIVAAQLRIAVAGQHLDNALLSLHDGHVEGSATKVVDEHAAQGGLARVVSQGRGRRLVEDAHDLQAGQFTSFAPGLAPGVGADVRLAVAENRHLAVGCTQIDANDDVHRLSPLSPLAACGYDRATRTWAKRKTRPRQR